MTVGGCWPSGQQFVSVCVPRCAITLWVHSTFMLYGGTHSRWRRISFTVIHSAVAIFSGLCTSSSDSSLTLCISLFLSFSLSFCRCTRCCSRLSNSFRFVCWLLQPLVATLIAFSFLFFFFSLFFLCLPLLSSPSSSFCSHHRG